MSASFAVLMYAFMGLPLLAIVVFNLIGKKRVERCCIPIGYIVSLVQVAVAIISMMLLVQYNKEAINFSQFWDMTVSVDAAYLSVDMFSLVALFSVGMVAFVSFLTGRTMVRGKVFAFSNVMLILMMGMNGIALVTDLFSLYVFLEVTGVASFVLIALYRDGFGLEGSFKYLVMSAIASAFILSGLAFTFMNFGSLQYAAISSAMADGLHLAPGNAIVQNAAFVLLIAGFSIKAGIVPFHGWLPDAYQSAPAPVSVVLGGIVTKMAGVYAIIRLLGDLFARESVVGTAFMLLGLVSIVIGAVAAIGQKDFKRILAYSSISQIGYIVLGVSTGSAIGLLGAVLHFFNHATFKTTLFVNSAAVEKQTGTTDITKLGGLQRQMPVTGVSSVIAFLSTAGIPPLAGFWSKLLIVIAAWQAGGALVAGVALIASLLTAAYFLRLQRNVFFGPAEEHLSEVTEASGAFKLASIILTVVTVGFGVLFPVLLNFMQAQGWL